MSLTLKYDFVSNPALTAAPGPTLFFQRSSIATFVDWEGIIRTVPANVPRFTGARVVTNHILQSQVTTSWILSGSGSKGTPTVAGAPDGTATATLMTFSTGGVYRPATVTGMKANEDRTASIYVKAPATGAATHVRLTTNDSLAWSTGSSVKVALTTSWQRIEVTDTMTTGAGAENVNIGAVDETIATDSDCYGDVLVWGMQLEQVSGQADQTASEYQATTTAAVTKFYPTATNKGILLDESTTNLALYSGDISDAAWVATNITKGTDSVVDPTGAANTNVRLTASAGNGTLLQTITSAIDNYAYSVYMKRITGTGDIDITLDNGATWTTQTLTSSWQRFYLLDASETNPVFGVRIVTSGDAIDFWGSMTEKDKTFHSSYIATEGTSELRQVEILNTTDLSWLNAAAGTVYWKGDQVWVVANGMAWQLDDTTGNERIGVNLQASSVPRVDVFDGGGAQVLIVGGSMSDGVDTELVNTWELNNIAMFQDGSQLGVTDTACTIPTFTTLHLGMRLSAGNLTLRGHIKEFRYYDERLDDDISTAMSNGVFPGGRTLQRELVRDLTRSIERDITS